MGGLCAIVGSVMIIEQGQYVLQETGLIVEQG
jgi:hypothetical protein